MEVASNLQRMESDDGPIGEEERRVKDILAHLDGPHWIYIRL